jgi:hypothetical protein
MIAAIILAVSTAALLQFFVPYCRSLIAASGAQPFSDQLREVTGIWNGEIGGEQFGRLLRLARLCPDTGNDGRAIAAVQVYFWLVSIGRATFLKVIPNAASWTERELSRCAYFAAIALDRRITCSRELMAYQVSNRF